MAAADEHSLSQVFNLVFAGRLQNLPPPSSKVVRIFTSSTFTDTTMERNALMEDVYPKIKEYCRELHGLDFQVVDMRWGVRDEATDDHMTTQLCMNEIYNCQRLSMGPNFVKYGYRPLPTTVLATELDMLKATLKEMKEDISPLDIWYRLDANAVPSVCVLQPISSILVNFNNKRMQKLQEQDSAAWWDVMGVMQRLVRKAAKFCADNGKISHEDMHNYFMSVTEREVINGVLKPQNTRDHCICYVRHINDINLNNLRSASKFIDIIGGQIDVEAAKLLSNLRDERVPGKLESTNIARFSIDWMGREGLDPISHQDYLLQFCEHFYKSITSLVDRAMKKNAKFMQDAVFNEVLQHLHMCYNVSGAFHGRETELKVLSDYLTGSSNEPLILHGVSGCGKTSVLGKAASLAHKWLGKREPIVIVRFIGTSPDSSTICPLLTSICDQIAYNYDLPRDSAPQELSQLFSYFKRMLESAQPTRMLVIFLDSLDLLSPVDGAHELLWFPPNLPQNVKLIASTTPSASPIFDSLHHIVETDSQYLEIVPLGLDLAELIVNEWLKLANRTLSQRQWETVKKALAKCTLPIFVKLIFATVVRWKSYSRMQDTILYSSVHESIQSLFERTEAQHGKLLVSHALSYISAAKNGISESELEDLISLDDKVLDDVYQYHLPPVRRIPPLLWTRIRADLPGYLSERDADGVIVLNWYHRQFSEAAIERYFKNMNHLHFTHSSLADYFLGVWANTSKPFHYTEVQRQRFGIAEREGLADRKVPAQPNLFHGRDGHSSRYNMRKLSELPYHLLRAERLDELFSKVLFNFDFLQCKVTSFPLQAVMADYEDAYRTISDKVVRRELLLVTDALRLSASILGKHPYMLAIEIVGRLLPLAEHHERVRDLVVQSCVNGGQINGLLPTHHCFHSPGGPLKYSLEDHNFAVFGMQLTTDKKMLISVSNRFIIWDMGTGDIVRQVDPKIQGILFGLSLSHNNKYAAAYSNNNEILVLNRLTGEFVSFRDPTVVEHMSIQGIKCANTELCFWTKTSWFVYSLDGTLVKSYTSADGKIILSMTFEAAEQLHFVLWSGIEADKQLTLHSHIGIGQEVQFQFQNGMALSHDQIILYACGEEKGIISVYNRKGNGWDCQPQRFEWPLESDEDVIALRLSETDEYLAAVMGFGYNIWQLASGHLYQLRLPHGVRNIPLRPMQTTSPSTFTFSHEFFAAGVRKNLYIWSVERQQLVQTLDAHFGRIISLLTLSTTAHNSVLSSSIDHSVKVWNVNNIFEKVFNIERLEKPIDHIQVAREEQHLAVAVTRKCAAIWNIKAHRLVSTFAESQHGAVVTHALITAYATQVVTVESNKLIVWNTQSGTIVARDKQENVRQLFFLENDTVVITVSTIEADSICCIVARKINDLSVVYRYDFTHKKLFDTVVLKGQAFMVVILQFKGKDHLQVIHSKTGTPVHKVKLSRTKNATGFMAMPHNSNQVALIDPDAGSIWDVKNKKLLRVVPRWNGSCTSDGKLGLFAPTRGGLEIIDMKTGETVRVCINRVVEGVNEIQAVFSTGNRYVLYYHKGKGTLSVFRVSDGRQIARLRPHAQLTYFTTTRDSKKLLVGGVDGSLLISAIVDTEVTDSLEFLAKQPGHKALAKHLGVENNENDDVATNLRAVGKAVAKFKSLVRKEQTSTACAIQ